MAPSPTGAVFQDPQWLAHWGRTRRLYFDIGASQEGGHGAMVFHVKRDYNHTNLKITPPSTAVEPIMFPSRLLTPVKKHYWTTELEVSCIVWVVRKIRHMIEAGYGITRHIPSSYVCKTRARAICQT
ncbi:hypothetical protein PENNAL_c0019G11277 [Penicillium nalgiovense]|uniref:Reverse transcriptase RNase H-like domain-containing protein n=1 Tax=Penicillium nalgiovense TaxID=60175 RepID=A0A1V6YKC9_PENNA|nr:hypothetical protein PENNAL_c0019G11277 [Penicillium nalgiovense]